MAIKSAPFYWVECDGCGTRHKYDDHIAWVTKDQAVDIAHESDWLIGGYGDAPEALGHYCWECQQPFICNECGEYQTLDEPCTECRDD